MGAHEMAAGASARAGVHAGVGAGARMTFASALRSEAVRLRRSPLVWLHGVLALALGGCAGAYFAWTCLLYTSIEGGIVFARFDARQITAVHTYHKRELLAVYLVLITEPPHVTAELFSFSNSIHGCIIWGVEKGDVEYILLSKRI